ncbi:MAG: cobalamin B12-binding domain-containing protein [Dehalococcoidia bacterium]|nr:cobalamin B12-binding domain-containing protein [Dehalococcoidia bacterium]
MTEKKRIRVLLAKAGLDGHDRGLYVVAMALRDAGMEVVYLGRHQSAERIVQVAIQEGVDVVGVSSLSDAHRTIMPKIVNLLRQKGAEDIMVILGGFIQPEDIPMLKEAGVAEVFRSGTKLDAIVSFIRERLWSQPGRPA